MWLPCVAIKFENISNNDIKEYIKVSAIFIDNNKNEQIGSDLAFLASSSESLLSHTSKQLSLTSGSGWAYFVNKSVTVKIYVGDEFVKSLKISNNEFDGTIQ